MPRSGTKPRSGFQQRVWEAIKRSHKSLYELVKAEGLHKPTISGWLRSKKPRLPFTPALLKFARKTGASLNHLLLDEGPPLRGQVAMPADLDAAVRAHILAELQQEATPDELRGALRYLGREAGPDKARAALRVDRDGRDVSPLQVLTDLCRAEIPGIRELRRQIKADLDQSERRDAARYRNGRADR